MPHPPRSSPTNQVADPSAGAPSYPVLVGRDGCEKPTNDAGGNNLTTARKVSVGESKSNAQAASAGRPNLPGLVPNPQPIPFPSKAELEKQGYRFGPFTVQHNPLDVEMIAHYAKQGYRPLEPHEVDYAEPRCNGVSFCAGGQCSIPAATTGAAKTTEGPGRDGKGRDGKGRDGSVAAQAAAIASSMRGARKRPPCAHEETIIIMDHESGIANDSTALWSGIPLDAWMNGIAKRLREKA